MYTTAPVWYHIPSKITTTTNKQPVMARCAVYQKDTAKVRVYRLKDDGTIFKEYKQQAVIIHRPTVDDTGDYMCVASNSAGRREYRFRVEVKGIWEFSNDRFFYNKVNRLLYPIYLEILIICGSNFL